VFTTFISYRSTQGLIEDNAWVFHTQEVLDQLLEISGNFRTAESSQRGFIIVGEAQYLEHYQESLREVDTHLHVLKKLIGDNPARKIQVQKLERLIDRRTAIMQSVLNTYKNAGPEKGRMELISSGGLYAMNEFIKLAEQIEADEKNYFKNG